MKDLPWLIEEVKAAMQNSASQNYDAYTSNGTIRTGYATSLGQYRDNCEKLAAAFQCNQEQKRMSGNKPIVVCGSEVKEAKDMDDAQAIAESLAHKSGADAYILKPVKKVAPKRDVVTTDL